MLKRFVFFAALAALIPALSQARIKDRNVDADAGIQASKISGGTFSNDSNEVGDSNNYFVFPASVAVTSQLYVSSAVVFTPTSVQDLSRATTPVALTGSFILVSSTGSMTRTAAPQITTNSLNGLEVTLLSTSAVTLTFQGLDKLANSCLQIGTGSYITVSSMTPRSFIQYNGVWYPKGGRGIP